MSQDCRVKKMIEDGIFAGYSQLAGRDIDSGDLDCQTARKAMASAGISQDWIDVFIVGFQLGIINCQQAMRQAVDEVFSLAQANPGTYLRN